MIYINLLILAAVFYGLWVLKLKPLTYKSHLKEKLQGVQKMLWDSEFKKYKSLQIREEVRMSYDQTKARVQTIKEAMDKFPALDLELAKLDYSDGKLIEEKKKKWSDEQNRVDDNKVLLERDLLRYESQMKQIDTDVFGAKPSAENPEGTQGIEHMIDSLQELKAIIIKDLKR